MSQALARSRARLRQRRVDRPPRPWGLGKLHLLVGAYLLAIIGVIVAYKVLFIPKISADLYFGIYGLVVTVYILSRFALSLAYRAPKERGLQPRVAIVMPGFNEEKAIATSLRSLLALDYPPEKLELVAVNDGSTDGTLAEMRAVAEEAGGRVTVIDFPENRGKRAAMAAGIRGARRTPPCGRPGRSWGRPRNGGWRRS